MSDPRTARRVQVPVPAPAPEKCPSCQDLGWIPDGYGMMDCPACAKGQARQAESVRIRNEQNRKRKPVPAPCEHGWVPIWERHENVGRQCWRCGQRELKPAPAPCDGVTSGQHSFQDENNSGYVSCIHCGMAEDAMTVGERKVVTVAVMSCGCEYVTVEATRPPSHCPEHGGTLMLVRYDSEPPAVRHA